MENFKIDLIISTKNLPKNANKLYFRDKNKSRALTLKEFKSCLIRLRCYRQSDVVRSNKTGDIIAKIELTDSKSRPFTGEWLTKWKKNTFIHKLRRKAIPLEIDVKYNELPMMSLKQAELALIKRALLETNGSIKLSAALLDIRPLLLQEKIRRYKLDN